MNNFVIFVPGTNAGDKVKVKITMVRDTFATGEVVGRSEETGETRETGETEETGDTQTE
jgi:tRNA/tmRNA/rRNA uracil-C5-methylase (TrmA/RlmC/RlmD family)